MPISITRVEKGIYLNIWEGRITVQEMEESEQRGLAMLEDDEQQIVLINDLGAATHFPMDIKMLKDHVQRNGKIAGIVMINTPLIARTVGEMQAKLNGWALYFVDTQEAALTKARAILAALNPNDPKP